jgi:hypothetical protein
MYLSQIKPIIPFLLKVCSYFQEFRYIVTEGDGSAPWFILAVNLVVSALEDAGPL